MLRVSMVFSLAWQMQRINIIGTTGSGKTTFAVALAEKLGYPCVQMDQLFWKPNWQEPSDKEFFPKLTKALAGEHWVLDGNYSRANTIKWERADTVIWLDLGYLRTLLRLLRRTVWRAYTRQELWPGTGNKESFSKSFMSGDSILAWFFRSYRKNKSRYSDLMQSSDYEHIEMIRLQSPNEMQIFLDAATEKCMRVGKAKPCR